MGLGEALRLAGLLGLSCGVGGGGRIPLCLCLCLPDCYPPPPPKPPGWAPCFANHHDGESKAWLMGACLSLSLGVLGKAFSVTRTDRLLQERKRGGSTQRTRQESRRFTERTQTPTQTQTHTHTQTHTRRHTQTYTQTYTHRHLHTPTRYLQGNICKCSPCMER